MKKRLDERTNVICEGAPRNGTTPSSYVTTDVRGIPKKGPMAT